NGPLVWGARPRLCGWRPRGRQRLRRARACPERERSHRMGRQRVDEDMLRAARSGHRRHSNCHAPEPPRSALVLWQFFTALGDYCAERYDEATNWAEKALRDQPNFGSALRILAAGHALRGSMEQAQKFMLRFRQLDPALRVSSIGNVMPPLRRKEDCIRYVEG